MKLSPVALAVSAAFVWGAAIFVIGGINSFVPGYGDAVLSLVVSIYPGFDADGSLGDLLLGTAYAAFDGLAAGLFFALLYNAVAHFASPATDAAGTSADDSSELDDEAGEEIPESGGEDNAAPADEQTPAPQGELFPEPTDDPQVEDRTEP